MKKIYEAKYDDSSKAKVFELEDGSYIVKFYNHLGIHMDASDFECSDRDYAIMMATPEDEEFLDHYEAYYGRNV